MAPAPHRFSGKTALVTGGTRGIGAAIAARLAEDGADVVVSARTDPGDTAFPVIEADMSVGDQVDELAAAVLDRFGRVDLLVSNAGHQTRRPGGVFEFSEDDWAADFAVNLHAAIRLDKLLVPAMVARGSGSVLHVSSGAARIARPASVAYSASKAALEVYSKALATEVAAAGVRVNAISPGLIHTSAADAVAAERGIDGSTLIGQTVQALNIPAGRAGTPEEFAAAATFLLSPEASYLTGSVWNVDGGLFPTV